MKKSMKKYLILLAVVAIVVTAVLTVSAAGETVTYCANPECNKNTNYYVDPADPNTYVEATCETIGYTRIKCTLCSQFMNSYINVVGPNKHEYETKYVNVGTYYEHHEKCKKCENITKPEPDVKYYKVSFYNPFATNGKDYYVDDCVYTDLVDADKYGAAAYKTKELAVMYVAEGEVASYTGQCVRESDKLFSDYTLVGWVSGSVEGLTENGEIKKDIIDARKISQMDYTTNEYLTPDAHAYVFGDKEKNEAPIYIVDTNTNNALQFTLPLQGEAEKADYVVYAVFEGIRETHTVKFKNHAGAIAKTVSVIHGFGASYGLADPIKPDDHQVYYTFDKEWKYYDGDFEHVIDLSNIYDSITVSPSFTMHSKTYFFQYYDKDGNAYLDANGEVLSDEVAVAGPGKDTYAPFNGRALDIKSHFDNYNLYTYTGLWKMSNRFDTQEIDIYEVTLPSNVLSYQETNGYIILEPSFDVAPRYYSIPIEIEYPDDNNNHPEDITVQIVSAEGVTRRVNLTEDDIINKKAVESSREPAKYHCVVQGMRYSELYRITATSRTYQGAAERVIFLTGDPAKMEDDGYSQVNIMLEHLKQKDCSCVCHTILKPIWVAILNLLNTLFKVEHVCCDDMFANIGDQLNYGK